MAAAVVTTHSRETVLLEGGPREEGQRLSAGLGTPWYFLEKGLGRGEVWAALVRMLHR